MLADGLTKLWAGRLMTDQTAEAMDRGIYGRVGVFLQGQGAGDCRLILHCNDLARLEGGSFLDKDHSWLWVLSGRLLEDGTKIPTLLRASSGTHSAGTLPSRLTRRGQNSR